MDIINGPVRRRLLEAASELFSRKGYSGTTVREIVAAAGVTKPALYYYFKKKEGIYIELMGETFAKFDRLLDATGNYQGSAEEKLRNLCDQTFSLFLENMKVARVMYSIYYGPQQGSPFFDFDSYHVKLIQSVRRIVGEGIEQKELYPGNSEHMSWVILGAIIIAMDLQLTHPEWGLDKVGLSGMLDLIFRGIAGERKAGEGERI